MYRATVFVIAWAASGIIAAQSQTEMTRQSVVRVTEADAELSKAVAAYRKRLNSDQRTLFDNSQTQWEQYRDSVCRFEASGVSGGSAEPMVIGECKAARTIERLRYIRRLSNCQEGDLSCPAWKPASNRRLVHDNFHASLRAARVASHPER